MYQLTKDPGKVKRLSDGAEIPEGHRWYDDYLAWLAEGNTPEPVGLPYELHSPEHYRAIRAAAWDWMTKEVVSRGYDGIESCASYYNSSIIRYQLEAHAMVAWRDAVNQALESLVMNPPPSISSWDQVRTLLPQPDSYDWPEKVDLPLGSSASEGMK